MPGPYGLKRAHTYGLNRAARTARSLPFVGAGHARPGGIRREVGTISLLATRHAAEVRRRRSPRLRGFDYATPGAYFLTICAHRGAQLFARSIGDEVRLTAAGRLVESCWGEIPSHFPSVELDAFVVMPNHVHGIVFLADVERGSALTVVVRSFKSAATRGIDVLRGTPGAPVWQRGYHERIVRDDDELEAIRRYVVENPVRWSADPENPSRTAIAASAPWL